MARTDRKEVKLSIIVPCYKVERYLKRCLDALLAQTLQEIEIVCINDGSPDHCLEILRDYEKKDARIRVIDKENEGVWKARMDGIRHSLGEYIGFADPDDFVLPDYALKLYRAARSHAADIACCGFDRVDESGTKRYSREMTRFAYECFDFRNDPGLLLEVNVALWNKIFCRKLLTSMGTIDAPPGALDDVMFSQLLYLHAKRIAFVKDSLIRYTIRQDSIVSSVRKELISGIRKAMLAVRKIYEREDQALLPYLDTAAFLNLGISLTHRLQGESRKDLQRIVGKNIAFLNRFFPFWKNSPYLKLSYVLTHKGANLKLYLVHKICKLRLLGDFLRMYGKLTAGLGIDLKW